MAVTYQQLMDLQRLGQKVHYAEEDAILYALSVGAAAEGINERNLPFVYEGRRMRTVPSIATVLMRAPILASGLDFSRVLHGEQRLTLHREIPASGTLIVDAGIAQVIDKGPEKGSVVLFESRARTTEGEPVFTTVTVLLARGDGDIGGPTGSLPPPHPIPQRNPDLTIAIPTRPDQTLLYRLHEDKNPLHVDPKVAAKAGFPGPILHGLCTYGLVCSTLVKTVCEGDPAQMASFDARFTGSVLPGDTLELGVWIDGKTLSFRCRVPARNQVVLDNGKSELRNE
ncbi:hypothetical protein LMG24238_07682 [Paraburkholderia sediminicola]|uniref:MaoC-like domain-containing protein n=1 Tax=Paraburkholderia sediminicola TaxID=458836 RepID=A0A6J5CTU5_9BURK|nr:hypothetical protein LMG24238_07682 [Paraburkholderia sediminicola]